MNREEAIREMNIRGSEHLPFFFIIDYTTNNCRVLSFYDSLQQGILFNFNGCKNYEPKQHFLPVSIIGKNPVTYSMYNIAFTYIQQQISLGNSYLVNLTFPTLITASGSLTEIFHSSQAKYRLLYEDRFVVYSPETFVMITDSIISTFPMKGTIDASLPGALELIINNKKEMAEHATVVDLLRNDLSLVANNVRVDKYRYAEEIVSGKKRLLQVSSEICGDLTPDYPSRLGNIIFEMLPAGSVTGAPKKKTLEIIAKAENYERGYYTGVAGYFDGKNLDSCVLIRFIENIEGKLFYKSGGGITSQSLPQEEYKELIDKIYVPFG
jgi:para-aminobenzoate synthetase component I